jgi:predicted Zn-dependent protease
MRLIAVLALCAAPLLSACVAPTPGKSPAPTTRPTTQKTPKPKFTPAAGQRYENVKRRVEPVAEAECRRLTNNQNCDFLIQLDPKANAPINAFQTRDKSGRPILIITKPMAAYVQNDDELAFVLSHEAAHHIAGHLDRRLQTAKVGALIFATAAARSGLQGRSLTEAAQVGAQVGARVYAKDFELEADAIGARIARSAGYDPINGARYFSRAPDPGDVFLGTHPPNAERIQTVRRAVGR